MRCSRGFSTDFIPTSNSAAVCLLALPSAISCSTSISREVSWKLRGVRPYGSIQRLLLDFEKEFRIERSENGLPPVNFPNRPANIMGCGLLEQKSHGTGRRCVFDICVVIVSRENDDFCAGNSFENLTCCFQAIKQRH